MVEYFPSELEDLGFILSTEFCAWGLDLWSFLLEILLYTLDLFAGKASKVFALRSSCGQDGFGSTTRA